MKSIILIVLLLITTNTYSQCKKYNYRPAPKIGEIMIISGIGFTGLGGISAFGNNSKANIVCGVFGIALSITGVYIDITSIHNEYKYKHKIKYKSSIFASGDKIGLRINF